MAHAQRPTATPGGLELVFGAAVVLTASLLAAQVSYKFGAWIGVISFPFAVLLAIGLANLRAWMRGPAPDDD